MIVLCVCPLWSYKYFSSLLSPSGQDSEVGEVLAVTVVACHPPAEGLRGGACWVELWVSGRGRQFAHIFQAA